VAETPKADEVAADKVVAVTLVDRDLAATLAVMDAAEGPL